MRSIYPKSIFPGFWGQKSGCGLCILADNTQLYTVIFQYLSTVLSPMEYSRIQGLLSDFQVLFKADLIFKDFSRKHSKFKYFSSLCETRVHRQTKVYHSFNTLGPHVRETVLGVCNQTFGLSNFFHAQLS